MNNLSDIKHNHNIIDIVGQYVQLKKSGKTHSGLCPFHSEKTPSFTVDEGKQFYHCFGCGANGDVISFVQEFSGLEYIDACKELGAKSDLLPSKKVQANIKAAKTRNPLLPSYDKRAPEKAQEFLSKCGQIEDRYQLKDSFYYAVTDFDGEIVNAVSVTGQLKFAAGGVSHLAGVWLKRNDTDNWLVVVDFWTGIKIAEHTKNNVLVSFSAYNTLLLCQYTDTIKRTPVLRYEDAQADALCDSGIWVYLSENGKLKKMSKGEYLD